MVPYAGQSVRRVQSSSVILHTWLERFLLTFTCRFDSEMTFLITLLRITRTACKSTGYRKSMRELEYIFSMCGG
jgi:hypothetical protein